MASYIKLSDNFILDLLLNIGLAVAACILVVFIFAIPLYLWLGSFHVILGIFDIYMDTSVFKLYLEPLITGMFISLIFGGGIYFLKKDKLYWQAILSSLLLCMLIFGMYIYVKNMYDNISQLKKTDTIVYAAEIKKGKKEKKQSVYTVKYWDSSYSIKQINHISEEIKIGPYNLIAINEESNVAFQNKNSISEATYEYCKGGVSMEELKRLEYLDKYDCQYASSAIFDNSTLSETSIETIECMVIDKKTSTFYKPICDDILIWYDKKRSVNGLVYDMVRLVYDKKNTYKYQIKEVRRKSDGVWYDIDGKKE